MGKPEPGPSREDHEAAARGLFDSFAMQADKSVCKCNGRGARCRECVSCIKGIAAALAEAVRVAVTDAREALQFYGRHTRGESDGCGWLKEGPCTCGLEAAIIAAGWTPEAQATPAPEVCGWKKRSYLPPCGKPEAWHQPLSLGSHPFTRGTPPETKERG